MSDQPTPREVAEAKVRESGSLPGWVIRYDPPDVWPKWFLNPYRQCAPGDSLTGPAYWATTFDVWDSDSAARAALLSAQERAGVYARPEKATCVCVELRSEAEDATTCDHHRPCWFCGACTDTDFCEGRKCECGRSYGCVLDKGDRRYKWSYKSDYCRLCSRGVPLKPNESKGADGTLYERRVTHDPLLAAGLVAAGVKVEVRIPAAPGGEGKCPECGREKAASIQDVVGGLCPKWWAFRDPDAERDCLHYRVTIPAAPGGAARKVEPTPRMKAFAEALDKGPPEPGALAGSVPVAPAGPGGEGKDQTMQEKYESLIPAIRSAARSLGYAVGVHGSMNRDLDLIAVPWEGDAAPPTYLAEAVRLAVLEACGACYLAGRETGDKFCEDGKPGWKPHGRLCWTYYLGGEPYIDLSVMPRLDVQGSVTIPAAAIRKGDSNV